MKDSCELGTEIFVKVTDPQGAAIYDDQKQLKQILAFGEEFLVGTFGKDEEEGYYFKGPLGYVSGAEVVLIATQAIHLQKLFPRPVNGKVKASHGTISQNDFGEQIRPYPLQTELTLVARGRSLLSEEFFQTDANEWVKTSDILLETESWIAEVTETATQKVGVVSPTGTLIYSAHQDNLEIVQQGEIRPVLASVVDHFGQHFWQIAPDAYVKKTDCAADIEMVATTFASYQLLKAPNINQDFWDVPNGCEAAALLEGFWYQGLLTDMDYQNWIDTMPISPDYDPYQGFGGSPYGIAKGRFEGIFPPALLKWGRKFGRLRDLTGANEQLLQEALQRGNPVVVYVTIDFEAPEPDTYPWGTTLANNHAVLLDGFTDDLWHVSDPIGGAYWLTKEKFVQSYEARHWAIEVLQK